jgi:hypothetical protein
MGKFSEDGIMAEENLSTMVAVQEMISSRIKSGAAYARVLGKVWHVESQAKSKSNVKVDIREGTAIHVWNCQ